MLDPATDVLEFTCPRCGQTSAARFFGPCATCTDALRAAYPGAARAVDVEEYAPKMNVTPNAVALKE